MSGRKLFHSKQFLFVVILGFFWVFFGSLTHYENLSKLLSLLVFYFP